ncbi:hypothetical protein GCM10009118_06790 [Wandonia haliotis]|uniref:Uncharacterized protein n=1 Tax=Wandonia haliotis TaxID=574963 RepID=A0ABN1MMZ9_9FLAO
MKNKENTAKAIMGGLALAAVFTTGNNANASEIIELGNGCEVRSALINGVEILTGDRAMELKCGEAKCGEKSQEAKCGEKSKEAKCGEKTKEAKCGEKSQEAKCGEKSKEAKCGNL